MLFNVLTVTNKDLSWINKDEYILADSTEKTKSVLHKCLSSKGVLGWDLETEGLCYFSHDIVGISFSWEEGKAAYIPLKHTFDQNVDFDQIKESLFEVLLTKPLAAHNAEFDYNRAYLRWGIKPNVKFCTLTEAWLLDSERGPKIRRRKLGLAYLAREKLKKESLSFRDISVEASSNFGLVKTSDALFYAAADADLCLQLHNLQYPEIKKKKLSKVYRIEMACMEAVCEMERTGILLDKKYLASINIKDELNFLEKEIMSKTGKSINLNSPEQIAKLLFDDLKLRDLKNRSTDDYVLELLEKDSLIPGLIRKYRQFSKIDSGFLAKLEDSVAEDGRMHLEYCRSGTVAGRFSSHGGIGRKGKKISINAQTWPKGKKVNVRKALIPSPGHVWASFDYKQIEYRILCYEAKQTNVVNAIKGGFDVHRAMTSFFFGVPPEDVTEDQRIIGKTLNFGIVYGMTPRGLAAQLQVSVEEAEKLKTKYFKRLRSVEKLIEKTKKDVLENKFVRTKFGRIRYFPNIEQLEDKTLYNVLKRGWNTFIQGTAADLNKLGLWKVYTYKEKTNLPIKILSTIHDEVNMEIKMEGTSPKDILPKIKRAMSFPEGMFEGWGSFDVDVQIGTSYGELISVDVSALSEKDTWQDLLAPKLKQPPPQNSANIPSSPHPKNENVDNIFSITAIRAKPALILTPKYKKKNGYVFEYSKKIQELKQLIENNYGAYNLYFQLHKKQEFFVEEYKVNPVPTLLQRINELGFDFTMVTEKHE